MDALDNPQQFQNSSVVEKSSKTGIFSNKRLLVIKNGYLYYFSKVPKGYKNHVPNILTTFVDLPKSSIQIKTIIEVRLQSAKSSSLIIKFYLKDMIDRQDIRKSIDSQVFSAPQKKNSTDADQWKFTFTTVLQCRLWYNALIKLKDYFRKLQNHFKDFVSNFDPKRGSISDIKEGRSQSDLKLTLNQKNPLDSPSNGSLSKTQHRKTQPIKFDPSKFITPKSNKSLQPNINMRIQQQEVDQKQINSQQQNQVSKQSKMLQSKTKKLNLIKQQEQNSQNGYHPNISQRIEPQIPQVNLIHSMQLKKTESFKSNNHLKQSHLIIQTINQEDQFKIRQIQQQIRQQLEIEITNKLQRQSENVISNYKHELTQKQTEIKRLENQLHKNQRLMEKRQTQLEDQRKKLQKKVEAEREKMKQKIDQMQKQKENQKKETLNSENERKNSGKNNQTAFNQKIFQRNQRKWIELGDQYSLSNGQDQDKNLKKHVRNDNTKPSQLIIQTNQFSVQTDQQQFNPHHLEQSQLHLNLSKQANISRQLNLSKETKIRNSFFSDYNITSNRNTLRQKDDKNILLQEEESFDRQNKQIQKQKNKHLYSYNYFYQQARLFEQGISSQERIQREVRFIQYVNSVKEKCTQIAVDYINQNNPTSVIQFQKDIFTFQIVCAPGTIMNIGGQNKLIYSNKLHQNIKRKYKIYQKVQSQIFKIMRKRKGKFNVRVPLCALIEYKGYSILGKVQLCSHEQQIKSSSQKYLKHLIGSQNYKNVKLSKAIINEQQNYQSQLNGSQGLLYLKVVETFKINDENANTCIFTSNNVASLSQENGQNNKSDYNNQIIITLLKQFQYCRNSNIALSVEKLRKQYYQITHQNNISDSNKLEEGKIKQQKSKIIEWIRITRELKKVYKSMQPYDKSSNHSSIDQEQRQLNNNHNDNAQNTQNSKHRKFMQQNPSQFMNKFFNQPTYLLNLISAQGFDFSKYNSYGSFPGYFYTLLEFFVGIRINSPMTNSHSLQNQQYKGLQQLSDANGSTPHDYPNKFTSSLHQPSNSIIPIVRSFHFPTLFTQQYIQKINKYLNLGNTQAAQKCLKLLSRISVSEIQPLLYKIKIYLKKKQYALAQQKIMLLRNYLPLHDLKNIQVNAYLIECYIFMGLQTEALKQIKNSLEYVEYMFSDTKNNIYQQNLHFLMAETLLRMGNFKEALKLYKNLLKQGKIQKDSIVISFSQMVQGQHNYNPDQIIPILLQFMEELPKSSQKRITLYLCLGRLYRRRQRKDKYIQYLQKAMDLSIEMKQNALMVEIYEMELKQIPFKKQDKKYQKYKQLMEHLDSRFLINEQTSLKLNTINFYHLLKAQQQKIQQGLQQQAELGNNQQAQSKAEFILRRFIDTYQLRQKSSTSFKTWQQLRACVNTLAQYKIQRSYGNQDQFRIFSEMFQSIDLNKLVSMLNASNSN